MVRCTEVHYYCNRGDCRKGFTHHSLLDWHLRMHDNDLIHCYFCPWGGAVAENYIAHMNHHFHIRSFKCIFCDLTFYRKSDRKKHEERFHEIIPDRYKCDICDYVTHVARKLNYHKHEHKINDEKI